MRRRTWPYGLQGVKFYMFILAIVGIALIVSVLHSQPAKAEGVLGKTVRCVVGGLLLGADCRTPTEQVPVVAPASEPQPAASSNSKPNSNTTSSPQPTQQPTSTTVSQLAPIENIELTVETPELPALPSVIHRNPPQFELAGFATVNNIPGSGTLGVSTLTFEPSREGWRVFGIPWYWFGVAVVAVFSISVWVKKRYVRSA